ncbi:dihydrofolate synthase / folylpolyglutamate synthase [Clostridium frigidicarnis]|uniref:tetrahydrofolate synthase n=2 Tax=Clostridium frigidicarnis TaxID=84698 RepID=A0A1I0UZE9_9CLOT|nr:dihydrofolate synthase / folylpolyglutamate synthase [Clostridium frigidicarnis]
MNTMNYNETMDYIHSVGKFGTNYGLSRTNRILELLGNPHKKIKTIHIAGTNGKGSTTCILSNILKENGFKVGMYTSPFLEDFEERMQINNTNIPKTRLCQVISKVKSVISTVTKEGLDDPTEFEIITCAALLYFYEEKVDYAVMEVGLGGRLDSTNVISPLVSVITSISYDHMNILGNTIEDIAKEKAGIIKESTPIILYPNEDKVLRVLENMAKSSNSPIVYVTRDMVQYKDVDKDTLSIKQKGLITINNKKILVTLGLLGEHQLLNAQVAIKAIETLEKVDDISIDEEVKIKALEDVSWKGRLEVLSTNPTIVIDGAHNIDGIKNLRNNVERYFKYNKIILILGILADKQVDDMIDVICPMASSIITVTPNSERATICNELKNHILRVNKNVEAVEDYEEAVKKALEYTAPNDLLLISGSLYMIGDMRRILTRKSF